MISRIPPRRVRLGPPRRGLVLDSDFLAWIRTQACVCCGTHRYIEAAHVGPRGLSAKCSDRETLPLCRAHHREGLQSYHYLGAKTFWRVWGLDRARLIAEYNERYEKEKAA